jgi:hypothetical protein
MELVGPNHRATAGSFMYYFYVFGEVINAAVGYFERDFADYFIWSSIILLAFALLFLFVPESPRYLVIRGKRQQAERIFRIIAKYNNRAHLIEPEISESSSESTNNYALKLKEQKDTESNKNLAPTPTTGEIKQGFFKGFKILFKSKKVLVQSFVILINW